MKRITLTLITLLFFSIISYGQKSCDQLPKKFNTYEEAVSKVKAADFKIKESVNTSKSSWIRGLSYYSCDGVTGFLIMKTDEKEYIHTGVPFALWMDFKSAS